MSLTPSNDLSKQRFGHWQVRGVAPLKATSRNRMWWCKCDCGEIQDVRATSLQRGLSKQCRWCSSRIAVAAAHVLRCGARS